MKRWAMVVNEVVVNVTLDNNRPFNSPLWKEVDTDGPVSPGWKYKDGVFTHPEDETFTHAELNPMSVE